MVKNRRLEEQGSGLGIRHLQSVVMFLGLGVTFALRVNMSFAIVVMTNYSNSTGNSTSADFETYEWDEKIKSVVLSSFFWGYIITQVPGGQIAQRYGAKFTIFTGILVCSIATLFTPLCASMGGWKAVCAIRIFQGIFQGMIFPSVHVLLSKWAPVEERGTFATFIYSGAQLGTVIMMALSGIIAASSMGWPGIFYSSAIAGILWCALWLWIGASQPSDYAKITPEEKSFIEKSLGHNENGVQKHLKTPWLKIVTSVPFLALLAVHCAHNWGFWTLMTQLPSYMKNALSLDLKSSALLSALPYTIKILLSYVFCFIAEVLSRKKFLSLGVSRKFFNSIGHCIPALCLIALGFITKENTTLAVIVLVIGVGMNAATYLGFQVNHIDLAPNFAGPMMGITNCFANSMAIIAPLLVGFIVSDQRDVSQWRIVFIIAAGVYLFGNSMFVIFGRTSTREWNDPDRKIQNDPVHNIRKRSSAVEWAEAP